MIFDEPTRGVDVGAIVEIHRFINELADDGVGGRRHLILPAGSPTALSDRILVARQGRIVEEMDLSEEATRSPRSCTRRFTERARAAQTPDGRFEGARNKIFLLNRNHAIISVFPPCDGETEMNDHPPPMAQATGARPEVRARRENRLERRERCFNLMMSGYTLSQIAKMVQASSATVRREVDRALAERRLDAPERFARVQVARLMKALRLAEAAVELGEMKAIATYLRVVAALDRYHELAAGPPPQAAEAPPLALPTPRKALTFAPLDDGESPAAEEVQAVEPPELSR